MEARKPGVYLCEGCGIGESIAVDQLESVAASAALCRRHEYLCSGDGVATIKKDIAEGTIDQAVIVACSPRVMTDKFAFNGTDVVRANVREQVVWTHPAGNPNTQNLAADTLRMAMAQAANTVAPVAVTEGPVSRRIMVVGGGISGLTAAREASALGHDVVLVERAAELGGWSRRWSRRMPHRPPYRDPQPNDMEALEALPGVGHKTASVVLTQAFGMAAFPVDTHIHRLAARWGLSDEKSVEKTERDLKALFARESWARLHLSMIYFGREHCPARGHDLTACPICSWAATKKRSLEEKRAGGGGPRSRAALAEQKTKSTRRP